MVSPIFKSFNAYKAPFVMKMRFHLPSKVNGAKNVAHAKYICDKAVQPSETEIHAQYIGERKGSRGLFGPDGIENLQDIQGQLKKHRGVVWRYILSLREEDAKRMGHNAKEDWERVIRQSIPGVTDAMGINLANARWVAAYHDAKGHPHVHLMMWEKEPQIERGTFDNKERKSIRRAFMNEFYGEERRQMMADRTIYRNIMRESAMFVMGMRPKKEAKTQSMVMSPVVLTNVVDDELNNKLVELRGLLPNKGRIALAFMPHKTADKARSIADWLMEQDGFREIRDQYLERVRGLTMHHTLNEDSIREAEQRALSDLRDRVAQVVLRAAATQQSRNYIFDALSASNAVWAVAFAITHMKQMDSRDSDFESKERTAKMMGEDKYERWKNKERLNMER